VAKAIILDSSLVKGTVIDPILWIGHSHYSYSFLKIQRKIPTFLTLNVICVGNVHQRSYQGAARDFRVTALLPYWYYKNYYKIILQIKTLPD
jgi:hypothetical protein